MKNASLASKKMTQLARQAMINRYVWDYTPEMMKKIRPKKILVRPEQFDDYLEDTIIFGTNLVTFIHFTMDHLLIDEEFLLVPDSIETLLFENMIVDIIDLSNKEHLTTIEFREDEGEDGFTGILKLPPTLEHLLLGFAFNRPLELPPRLKELSFYDSSVFNQPLRLTSTLEILWFGTDFNQPINLPIGLKHFISGSSFNQRVYLPDSLEYLVLGESFNQPDTRLPPHMDEVAIVNSSVEYEFPNGISEIAVSQTYVDTFGITILPGKSKQKTRIRVAF